MKKRKSANPSMEPSNENTNAHEKQKQTSDDSKAEYLEPIVLQSKDLFNGRQEIWIEHESQMYRLRATATGRLYLTK